MAENQSLGEIISRDDADQQFGPPRISILIDSVQLQKLAGETSDLMMFNIIEGTLVILGDDRKLIYPDKFQVPVDSIFRVYSRSKVLELIEAGGAEENSVEFRGDTLTITNSDSTLEFGALCPPLCGIG